MKEKNELQITATVESAERAKELLDELEALNEKNQCTIYLTIQAAQEFCM